MGHRKNLKKIGSTLIFLKIGPETFQLSLLSFSIEKLEKSGFQLLTTLIVLLKNNEQEKNQMVRDR